MSNSNKVRILAFLGILFVALNLRAPFTAVAPVLGQIMEGLSLSSSAAGFLTALPLLSFAIFSPMSASLSRRIGLYPSLTIALVLIGLGITLRSLGFQSFLYLGTVMLGAGIAVGNVLLPVVVKVNFPTKIAVITSLYIFAMGVSSTLSSSLMVPISGIELYGFTGWQLALFLNLLFPIIALMIWIPQKMSGASSSDTTTSDSSGLMFKMLKCPVAWHLTLGVGLNSFIFYSFAGWLPKILHDFGYDEITSGYIYGFLQFSTMVPGLLLVPILSRVRSQRQLVSLTAILSVLGAVGMILLPQFAILWVGVFGLANCSTFIIGISFIGLRTETPLQAAALSGMSQSIGYGLAATGPSIIGYLHGATDSWTASLVMITVVASICGVFINLAARDRMVLTRGRYNQNLD
ncbi:MFS transporter [Vibrio sp. RC27]